MLWPHTKILVVFEEYIRGWLKFDCLREGLITTSFLFKAHYELLTEIQQILLRDTKFPLDTMQLAY